MTINRIAHAARSRLSGRTTSVIGSLATALLILSLVSVACSPGSDPDPTPTPMPTATPTVTPTPTPTPTPTATPSPTPFVPPTVAVQDDDSIESCLERNMTPELLISLSLDQTELTEDVLRACLETTIPAPLVFLLDPVIEDASECALEVSDTLSNDELIALAGEDGASKDVVVERVVDDILSCLQDKYDWLL